VASPAAAPPKAPGQKILGMPRTTGIIVIGLGALLVGYFIISRVGGSKSSTGSGSGSGSGGGGGGGRPSYASGGTTIVRVIRDHQGHKPRPGPKPVKHHKGK
jgi:hypothetical protein